LKKISCFKKQKLLQLLAARKRKQHRRKKNFGESRSMKIVHLQAAKHDFELRRRCCGNFKTEDRPSDGRVALICPQELNITNNYSETLGFFANLQNFIHIQRTKRNRRKYIEFCNLKTIDIGSLLVLAAELDMTLGHASKSKFRRELIPADVHLWQVGIAYLFHQFGILELTGYRARFQGDDIPEHPYLKPKKFQCDKMVAKFTLH